MSNVNIGFVDGRSCSRILKPPGGGYSDIFFTDDTPKKTRPVTKTESQKIIENADKTDDIQQTEIKQCETAEEDVTDKIDTLKIEKEQPKSPEPMQTPKRTRVPPGGYSSGLW